MAADLTAIATAAEYKARNNRSSGGSDALLDTLLFSLTRLVERRIGVAPGMLKPQTDLTFVFDGSGDKRLYLRDERGSQYLLRKITADSLKIDNSLNGLYADYALDFADTWVQGIPTNADQFSEPYTAIDFVPYTSATILVWPPFAASVQITGNWGYATTPGPLKERVIGICRELVEMHASGGAGVLQDIETAVQMNGNARALMYLLEQEYNRRLLV